MKHISIILLAWMSLFQTGQGLYACKNVEISLFSSAPIEDIAAKTSSGQSVYNAATGDLVFSVAINTFKFPKSAIIWKAINIRMPYLKVRYRSIRTLPETAPILSPSPAYLTCIT
jgi:hypothetical protein